MRPEDHITRELLEAVARGEVSPHVLVERVARHLVDLCPTCRQDYQSFFDARRRSTRPSAYSIAPLLEVLGRWQSELEDLHRIAERELVELLSLPAAERRVRVERATKRFSNPVLAELLLEDSGRRLFDDPREACSLAQLAIEVTLRIGIGRYGMELPHELLLRATAHKANALRVAGDLKAAEEILVASLRKIDEIADPLIRAEIASLAASLYRDQRRFAEALELLDRTIAIYREAADRQMAGRNLVKKGEVLRDMGQPEPALEAARAALKLIDPRADLRLYLCAQHNLAHYLSDVGFYAEAQEILDTHRELYGHFPDGWTRLRHRWLEGKIAQGLGKPEEAEEAFLTVRDGFVERAMGYDASLVSLDLALLYAQAGRTAETRKLAEEMLPIFRAQDIHREATAALLIFYDAARRETVTVGMVRDLAIYLERARRDPTLRYETSSSWRAFDSGASRDGAPS